MAIVITKRDSSRTIKKKLELAEKKAAEIRKKEIFALCGSLKNKIKEEPVELIRKMRDDD